MVGPGRPPSNNRTPELRAMQMMAKAMRDQAQATANLVAHLTRGTPTGSVDTTRANAQASGFTEFRKNLPPSFSGECDPVAAEAWLQEIKGNQAKVEVERPLPPHKRRNEEVKGGSSFKFLKGGNKGKQVATSTNRKLDLCSRCGKGHKGICLVGQNICYGCHQPGHILKNCPTRNKTRVPNQTAQTKERVFALSGEETKKDTNLISGICFLNQVPLIVLYD